ncbi:MAG: hypothetical protein B7Y77_00810 [Bradyrhizobium sp. 35-63-5]|nr:MAG: hypothetical protein B7Y77_00810 [Bradyrhizobium sp. 35-63-5]
MFGRSRRFRIALGAAVIVIAFFTVTLWALDRFFPNGGDAKQAVASLPPLPPLQPIAQKSFVIAPVAIALDAIQRSLEASAPRQLTGKNDNPLSGLLSKADIGMTITRGNIAVNGKANELIATTQLNGILKVTGQLGSQAGNVAGGLSGSIAGLLGGSLGKDVGKAVGGVTGRVLDQNVELHSQVTVHAKPSVAANWRLQPNLSAQVAIGNSAVQVVGLKINMANEARPLIERAVNEQVAALEQRLRNDPFLERSARDQWAKMCRSIPLGGGNTGLPQLWLEIKPTRAVSAQPRVDARNLLLAVGVEADTRITAQQTKPSCPFPATLDLVAPMDNGRLAIALPIDVPFTDLSKLLDAQLKGHRYPEGTDAPVEVEVRSASLAAAGDRILIALKVKAHERKSWFGFGAEANVHIWGKPTLDASTQVLRLTDVTLDIDTSSGYGLLNAAARAALPYLQQAIADQAKIDLTPFLNDAKAKIGVALADFRKNGNGVTVDADVHDLRLTGIAFDSNTLRVVAEADGGVKVAVTDLPRF